MNFSEKDPCYCPRDVLRYRRAHCMEGALLAAAALWYHGNKPLLLDLTTTRDDQDHVVALFKKNGYWGAISKTNHAVLRYREPVYKTIRELAMSYFHEYFLNDGEKTLRTYSRPFNLSKYKTWLTNRGEIMTIIQDMSESPHFPVATAGQIRSLRRASSIETRAGRITEWTRNKKRLR